MTKEELEKETEIWVKKEYPTLEINAVAERYCKAYLAGAEPREKQIQIDAKQIRALQKTNGALTDKVRGLEAQIEKMKCCGNCKHFDFNEPNYCHKGVYRKRQYVCSKWEFSN